MHDSPYTHKSQNWQPSISLTFFFLRCKERNLMGPEPKSLAVGDVTTARDVKKRFARKGRLRPGVCKDEILAVPCRYWLHCYREAHAKLMRRVVDREEELKCHRDNSNRS